jgi:hypothetical protein
MSKKNPHTNPLDGKSGYTHELLAQLTAEELEEFLAYNRWEQENRRFTETNAYTSRAYHTYRTRRWAGMVAEERKDRETDRAQEP